MLLASIVTVTNAGAAPSLDTSTPIDLCEVICCGAAFNTKVCESLTVAITEELLKFIVVILIIYPNKAFDEPFDGIVYSVFVGMGFATAENLTFVMQGNTSVALFRMLSAIPAHFVFAVVIGYYLGIAKSKRKSC